MTEKCSKLCRSHSSPDMYLGLLDGLPGGPLDDSLNDPPDSPPNGLPDGPPDDPPDGPPNGQRLARPRSAAQNCTPCSHPCGLVRLGLLRDDDQVPRPRFPHHGAEWACGECSGSGSISPGQDRCFWGCARRPSTPHVRVTWPPWWRPRRQLSGVAAYSTTALPLPGRSSQPQTVQAKSGITLCRRRESEYV